MNYTRAAEERHMTQPAVSQQIRSLENELGARLFEYSHRKLELTEAGRKFRSACTTLRNDFARLADEMKMEEDGKRRINMGATLTIGEYVLPRIIGDFAKKKTDCQISLLIQDTAIILKALDKGSIDFAFVEGYFPKEQYDHITWRREQLVPVCAPGHPLLERPAIGIDELLEETLILREKGSGTRETLENFLACENISVKDFKHSLEIGGIEAIKKIVASGYGITFLYASAVADEEADGRLSWLPFARVFDNDFTFIWRKGSLYSEEYKDFFKEFTGEGHG